MQLFSRVLVHAYLRKILLNSWLFSGFFLKDGTKCFVYYYGIIGDCPALKLILEFISHVGYYPCFYCYIKGVHVGGRGGKRQYYCADSTALRQAVAYEFESHEAANNSSNVFGHLGRSILHDILDVPLPNSIIIDYLHVTLLRHMRAIMQQTYMKLRPEQRTQLDTRLRSQSFPHFFNRKVRPISDLSFVK